MTVHFEYFCYFIFGSFFSVIFILIAANTPLRAFSYISTHLNYSSDFVTLGYYTFSYCLGTSHEISIFIFLIRNGVFL